MRPADTWKDYELLDATDGNRLERWGETLLIRPDPQVVWKTPKQSPLWAKADAIYHRSNQGGGEWEYRRRLPEKWKISCGEGEDKLTLIVSPTGFKHTGVFPEQAVNWAWYQQKIRRRRYAGLCRCRCYRLPCGCLQGHRGMGQGQRRGKRPDRQAHPLAGGRLRQIRGAGKAPR